MCFQFTSVMNIKGDNCRKHFFGYIQKLYSIASLIFPACKSANEHVLICCVTYLKVQSKVMFFYA